MGALHAGHISLISRAASENPLTVVSIFINPAQFTDQEDLARYPRNLDRDIGLANEAGADVIFAPGVDAMYPAGFSTTVDVGDLSQRWEGASRPGHLRGVATVVTILLNLVQPARSYFGEKDWQQLQVIRRLHRDLVLPGEIIGCPTVRDDDDLAMSSRNARLTGHERTLARRIPEAIAAVRSAVNSGERDVEKLLADGVTRLDVDGLTIDYFAIVDERTLEPLQFLTEGARLLVAASIGATRLVDNAAIEPVVPGGPPRGI
ncbi:MAG: pantoate--beta-alanine ligase [Chloroflexia bacterium]|nr:pantoate--beta-alanine ligase [Chloroflexia bacterium]